MYCQICLESDIKILITCTCGYKTCESCVVECIKNKIYLCCPNPSCELNWSLEFIVNNFSKDFIFGSYKSMIIERLKKLYLSSADDIKYKIYQKYHEICKMLEEKTADMHEMIMNSSEDKYLLILEQCLILEGERDSIIYDTYKERKTGTCVSTICHGITFDNICTYCSKSACYKCNKIIEDNHECNPNDIEEYELSKTIIRCPWCSIGIERTFGCSHMMCTNCNTRFDYNTMKIQSNNSNEHYKGSENTKLKGEIVAINLKSKISKIITNKNLTEEMWYNHINVIYEESWLEFIKNRLIIETCDKHDEILKLYNNLMSNINKNNEILKLYTREESKISVPIKFETNKLKYLCNQNIKYYNNITENLDILTKINRNKKLISELFNLKL